MELKFVDNYYETAKFAGITVNPFLLVAGGLLLGFALFVALSAYDVVFGLLMFLLCLDASIGLPYFLADRKVDAIESRLPDILHHVGTTLKTGSTIEVALKEVSMLDYGPVTVAVRKMLDQMNKGKTFEQAFSEFARESRSGLVEKLSIIMIAARRSGGSLLQTLTLMAEDIRSLARLKRERKTKTVMQFLFIVVAGWIIAPFIFGILRSVLFVLLSIDPANSKGILADFDLTFKLYLALEAALTTVGAVMIREGNWTKSVLYIPVALLTSYSIYMLVSTFFVPLLGA